jgi:hypothetical protein
MLCIIVIIIPSCFNLTILTPFTQFVTWFVIYFPRVFVCELLIDILSLTFLCSSAIGLMPVVPKHHSKEMNWTELLSLGLCKT